jgi:TatD DNase family protein
VVEVFKQLPRERILLETDAPDMLPPAEVIRHPVAGNLNHPANLPAIGHALAKVLGLSPAVLAELTAENACACFGKFPG